MPLPRTLAPRALVALLATGMTGCQSLNLGGLMPGAFASTPATPSPGTPPQSYPPASFPPQSFSPSPSSTFGPAPAAPQQGIHPTDLPTPTPTGASGECPASVGLVGDSITAAAGWPAALRQRCPGTTFVNSPRAYAYVGKNTRQMRSDFETPLGAGHQVLVILGGVNNIAEPTQVGADLAAMYEAAQARGVKVVALTVMPYQGYSSWTPERGQAVRQVGDWIRAQGSAGKVARVVDAFALFSDPASPDAARPGWTSDRLHPSATGYAALADAVAAALRSLR